MNIQNVGYSTTTAVKSFPTKVKEDFRRNLELYIIVLPVIAYYLIFHYKPMYGAIIAFQDYSPEKGIAGSSWVGFKNFIDFFQGMYFWRLMRNTLLISINTLIFGFPAPIILALMLNEIRSKTYARIVQSISYMPHFISLMVICGMIITFTSDNGIITQFASLFGYEAAPMLTKPGLFIPIYVLSGIWQEIGWGSIIYIAALSSIDQQQYEAARIDGAGRWRQMVNITLPGIAPTIIIMFILRMGNMLNVGFEKIILLYNPSIYETSDVVSSYVYRIGIVQTDWSFSSAVGLFNSSINLLLLFIANWLSRKLNETSLW